MKQLIKKSFPISILFVCVIFIGACSSKSAPEQAASNTTYESIPESDKLGGSSTSKQAAISANNEESLAHYKLGKRYSAQGRYELAKEQYTIALAAANDDIIKLTLMRELDNTNKIIKSLR